MPTPEVELRVLAAIRDCAVSWGETLPHSLLREMAAAACSALRELPHPVGDYLPDEAPTQKLPPIGSTVRRRPPVPGVRELKGAELLRALAEELDRDDLGDEDL